MLNFIIEKNSKQEGKCIEQLPNLMDIYYLAAPPRTQIPIHICSGTCAKAKPKIHFFLSIQGVERRLRAAAQPCAETICAFLRTVAHCLSLQAPQVDVVANERNPFPPLGSAPQVLPPWSQKAPQRYPPPQRHSACSL